MIIAEVKKVERVVVTMSKEDAEELEWRLRYFEGCEPVSPMGRLYYALRHKRA